MAESNFSLQKTLTMLLDEKKYHSLRDILSTMNPADIAAIFDDLDQARLPLLFRLLPKELATPSVRRNGAGERRDSDSGATRIQSCRVIRQGFTSSDARRYRGGNARRASCHAHPDPRPSRICASRSTQILRCCGEIPPARSMTTEYVSLRAPNADGPGSDFAHPPHGHRQRGSDLHLLRDARPQAHSALT
ncbi:MAG: hypothetical protein ACLTCV_04990 [Oscillospiraceae bacterium]